MVATALLFCMLHCLWNMHCFWFLVYIKAGANSKSAWCQTWNIMSIFFFICQLFKMAVMTSLFCNIHCLWHMHCFFNGFLSIWSYWLVIFHLDVTATGRTVDYHVYAPPPLPRPSCPHTIVTLRNLSRAYIIKTKNWIKDMSALSAFAYL